MNPSNLNCPTITRIKVQQLNDTFRRDLGFGGALDLPPLTLTPHNLAGG